MVRQEPALVESTIPQSACRDPGNGTPARGRRAPRRLLRWAMRLLILALLLSLLGLAALAVVWHVCPFPVERLEQWPASPQVLDRHGRPMLELVGHDDHWRFPARLEQISPWLVKATIAVEDARFERHVGIDPAAVGRAVMQNVRSGRIVSGASTLTMQLCRMMDDRPRTLGAKLIESFRAVQLERLLSKDEILELYLNVAPYGGNLRGVEAASLAYFGKSARDLSLGEAALIAGLPQSPSRLRPDRHPDRAAQRRRIVLSRMLELGMIDQRRHDDAAAMPIAMEGRGLRSMHATHAAWLALQRRSAGSRTTLDLAVQHEVERCVQRHHTSLPEGSQVAVAVIDLEDGAILAMVGAADPHDERSGQVNGVTARRSPGSALKPFIYAAAFEAGRLDARSTVYDVPIHRDGWSPHNFEGGFEGEVTAAEALGRSLNVPAILVAEGVGLDRGLGTIEAAGIRLGDGAATRGGLAAVVGAVEVTLLDLTNGYATLGRGGVRMPPRLFADEPVESVRVLGRHACAVVDDILASHRRRPSGMMDLAPGDVPWFTWKTGTSSGRRDAWAVGHNGRYAIGVWAGRFDGRADPAFIGRSAAEPLLGALFDMPTLRRDAAAAPPPPDPIPITHPLAPPPEAGGALRILHPAPGARFIAVDGRVRVPVAANRGRDVRWLLNGRLIDPGNPGRLDLGIGTYELRCIDGRGDVATIRFTVADRPSR